ncbi:hypothetical protein NDU88_001823 [Pleurodeles waltl]|uniref:Uncharacterized protein n=1 Tax=Pleurodeles waltl TaxID=8319 RepID=A0AAV7UVF6_PLEWA|nr:hypothetical protein NDU88_001823 [Pleurodeles waltl]
MRPLPCWKPRPDVVRSAAAGARRAARVHRRLRRRLNLPLRGRLAAPPLAESRGPVVSGRQQQEQGGRTRCGCARNCVASPDRGPWGP